MTLVEIAKQYAKDIVLTQFITAGLVTLLFAVMPVSVCAKTATDYIRQKQGNIVGDPLILAFKETLAASKTGHWDRVSDVVSRIWPALISYYEDFGVDLRKPMEMAVADKNYRETMKVFAHAIFLGLQDNVQAAIDARDDYIQAFGYLVTARSYYRQILAGNIKRKRPDLHKEISRLFVAAELALGSSGKADAVKIAPDLGAFVVLTGEIEIKIQSVYTYFDH